MHYSRTMKITVVLVIAGLVGVIVYNLVRAYAH